METCIVGCPPPPAASLLRSSSCCLCAASSCLYGSVSRQVFSSTRTVWSSVSAEAPGVWRTTSGRFVVSVVQFTVFARSAYRNLRYVYAN
eukprot:355603-Chlamydomonas_euryale.AAC.1